MHLCRKKNCMTSPQQKYMTLPQKQITRMDSFFVHELHFLRWNILYAGFLAITGVVMLCSPPPPPIPSRWCPGPCKVVEGQAAVRWWQMGNSHPTSTQVSGAVWSDNAVCQQGTAGASPTPLCQSIQGLPFVLAGAQRRATGRRRPDQGHDAWRTDVDSWRSFPTRRSVRRRAVWRRGGCRAVMRCSGLRRRGCQAPAVAWSKGHRQRNAT